MRYQADVTLAVRLDPDNREELDYYLLPWLDLPRQEIRLCNRTSIAFEAFRFEDLVFSTEWPSGSGFAGNGDEGQDGANRPKYKT